MSSAVNKAPFCTTELIQQEALNGRSFLYSNSKSNQLQWEQIGWIEWIFRKIFHFLPFISSVEHICAERSWSAIGKEVYQNPDIIPHIERYFLESRNESHPLNAFSFIITGIYMSVNKVGPQFQTHRKLRLFDQCHVAQDVVDRVASVGPNRLNFYDRDDKKNYESRGTELFNSLGKRITVLKHNYQDKYWEHFSNQKIEAIGDDGTSLFVVAQEGDKESFVFREPQTLKVLAVAILINSWNAKLQGLSIAIIDHNHLKTKKIELIHLLFPLFYKAEMNFRDPSILPYVDDRTLLEHPSRLI